MQNPKPSALKGAFYLLGIAWRHSRGRVAGEFFRAFLGYSNWVFYSVVFTRFLVSSIETKRPLSQIFIFIGAAMAFFAFTDFFGRWFSHRYASVKDNLIGAALRKTLFAKAMSVDLSCYEDPGFYDRFTLAQKEAVDRTAAITGKAATVASGVVASVAVIASVIAIDPFVILFMGFPLIGQFVFARLGNGAMWKRDREMEPWKRRAGYVNRVLYLPDYAKEIRLSRAGKILERSLESGYEGMARVAVSRFNAVAWWDYAKNVFTFILPFQGAFLYGAWLALSKQSIGAGEYAVLASAVVSASWMFINLSNDLVDIHKGGLYAENLRGFLEYENRISDKPDALPVPRDFSTIEFRDLRFSYARHESATAVKEDASVEADASPVPSRPVIDGFNMTIRRGEKIAIVGRNGAGKTSIVKLLLRLYDPDSGAILLDGKPLGDYRVADWRGLFGTAFQDFRLLSATVAENVLMRKPEGEADRAKVEKALALAGLSERVGRMVNGMDTVIGREHCETGETLSGGEGQKLAMARAFAGDFKIGVFDEPSSALDPIAELGLFKSIMRCCEGKTLIFISHRLSSATLADRVCLVDSGKIIEEGSHAGLMAKGGSYAELFAMQAQNYLKDNWATIAEDEA